MSTITNLRKQNSRPAGMALGLMVMAAVFLTPAVWAQGKVGTVDLKKVFDGYYRTKQADAQLKERAADLDKAMNGMKEEFKKAKDEYDQLMQASNDPTLSAEERDKRKQAGQKKLVELRQIETDLAQFDRTSRTSLGEQQRRMRDRIMDSIKEVVQSKAKERGLSLVIDVAADSRNETPVVLFSTGENDLSEVVLSELNSRGAVDLPVGTEKTEEKK